jgi:hypothetical protein
MIHFIEAYADRVNDLLHDCFGTAFFKQEIVEVPGLLAGVLITYDGIRDDAREQLGRMSWQKFLTRMSLIKPDWKDFDRKLMKQFMEEPRLMGGWEGRTIFFLRGARYRDQWTPAKAESDVFTLMAGALPRWGHIIQTEVEHMRGTIPVGTEHFREYEHQVRVTWNFLFSREELGQGQAQSRTEPENEGVEIRDIIFANRSDTGFWKDLKDKYSASEIVVDAKNKDCLTRDDLRQLYCYLKPALGFWGFIVCRSQPSATIQAFNRTLCKNFSQKRGVLILCDDDLRKMVRIANRGHKASEYLQERMTEFVRSI